MRLDLLLCRLRFAKSRAVAQRWVAEGHLRVNGQRAIRPDQAIRAGDVLTLAMGGAEGGRVQVIALDALPERRGPAREAQAHYRVLDGSGSLAIAGAEHSKDPRLP